MLSPLGPINQRQRLEFELSPCMFTWAVHACMFTWAQPVSWYLIVLLEKPLEAEQRSKKEPPHKGNGTLFLCDESATPFLPNR